MSPQSQRIKILAMKLSSLRAELETSRDAANSASLEIDRLYYEKYKPEKQKQEDQKPEPTRAPNNDLERHPSQDVELNPDTKSAFRKIALKIHPDKLETFPEGPEKENKKSLYQKAIKAAEEGDLITLASISIDLGIDCPEVSDEHIKKANNEISAIKEKIKHIESTYVWQWLFCTDRDKKKQLLEKMFELIYERNKNKNTWP